MHLPAREWGNKMSVGVGVRVSEELYRLCKEAGKKEKRSASMQLQYWAEKGREVEEKLEKEKRDIAPTSPA